MPLAVARHRYRSVRGTWFAVRVAAGDGFLMLGGSWAIMYLVGTGEGSEYYLGIQALIRDGGVILTAPPKPIPKLF